MDDLTFWERCKSYWKRTGSFWSFFMIFLGVGGIMAWIVIKNYGLADTIVLKDRYLILCNAFTIPGVVILCLSGLVLVSREGVFDGFAYVGYAVKTMFTRVKEHVRYGDFVLERRDKRSEKKSNVLPIFIVGCIYTVVALVYLYLFYRS